MSTLSRGALKSILTDNKIVKNPVLQVTQIKTIQNANENTTRYKVSLSDGETVHTFGILATQKNFLIDEGKLKVDSIIRLTEYAPNVLSKEPQKVVLILMNFDILSSDEADDDCAADSDSEYLSAKETQRVTNENLEPNRNQSPVKQQVASTTASGINSSKFFKHDAYNKPVNNKAQPTVFATSANNNSMMNASTASNSAQSKICTISSLNPYQNKWTIKARVTNKSNIRTWSNSKGDGKLFSVDFIDQTGEIKATCFNDTCDKFYDLFQIDQVYMISKAQLKTANKQYTTINNDYEMSFTNETTVEQCSDEQDDVIPRICVNLIPLSELLNKNANDLVDVIGVVRSFSEVTTIVTKATQKELKKREINIVDSSNCAVNVTMWAKMAEDFDGSDNPVVLLKSVKVSDYNGRQLGIQSSSTVQINPDIPEAHTLRGWYDQGGNQVDIQDISNQSGGGSAGGSSTQANWKSLEQIREEQLGMHDKADYFTSTATITFAKKENSMYQACSSDNCNKKVVDQNNGMFRCEKCNKDSDTYRWRMILSINIADHSESQWVTCFQETAEKILEIQAQELGDLKNQNNPSYDECFSNCVFKEYSFKLRAKMETYNDERRVKVTVASVDPIDYLACGKRLLTKIKYFVNSQSYN